MKSWFRISIAILFILGILASTSTAFAQSGDLPVVKAILFYSPTCPHCHVVINESLPPIVEKYGSQLLIVGIDTTTAQGQSLYLAAVDAFQVPQERTGVPALYVGDTLLVGEVEIPEQLPGIIDTGLAQGGIDWPAIPGLEDVVDMAISGAKSTSAEETATGENSVDDASVGTNIDNLEIQPNTMWERFQNDLAGNTIAVIVLVGMIVTMVLMLIRFNKPVLGADLWPHWLIPIFAAIGIFVASYLTFVEATGAEAVCGPVGDCNSVQSSPFAMLFGFLPVGILGLIGFIGILIAWVLQQFGPENFRNTASLGLWGMSIFGVFFSIYLTFLEPFVIGATCMWCITSAIVMTLLLIATTDPARRAFDLGDDENE